MRTWKVVVTTVNRDYYTKVDAYDIQGIVNELLSEEFMLIPEGNKQHLVAKAHVIAVAVE